MVEVGGLLDEALGEPRSDGRGHVLGHRGDFAVTAAGTVTGHDTIASG